MKKTDTFPKLFHAGLTPTKIVTHLGISRTAVYKIKKKLEDLVTGTLKGKFGSGQPWSVRTKAMIAKVKLNIKPNPVRSMRKMASELNISNSHAQRVVKCDLKMKCRLLEPMLNYSHSYDYYSTTITCINALYH